MNGAYGKKPGQRRMVPKKETALKQEECGVKNSNGVTKQVIRIKEFVGAIVFLGALIGGVIMGGVAIRDRLNGIEDTLESSKKVQRYLMLNAQHTGDVLEHVAQKRNGSPPSRPAELRSAELELLP